MEIDCSRECQKKEAELWAAIFSNLKMSYLYALFLYVTFAGSLLILGSLKAASATDPSIYALKEHMCIWRFVSLCWARVGHGRECPLGFSVRVQPTNHIKFIRNFESMWKVAAVRMRIQSLTHSLTWLVGRSLTQTLIHQVIWPFYTIFWCECFLYFSLQLPGYLAHTNIVPTIFNIIGSNCRWTRNTKSTVQGHGALYGAFQPVC